MSDILKIIIAGGAATHGSAASVSPPSGVPGTLAELVQRAIVPIFTIAGVALFGLLVYGGFKWLTSGGEAGKIKEATGTIVNAIIGIAIVLSAALLTRIVGNLLGYPGMGIF